MGKLESRHGQVNINVTLAREREALGELADREFPCPLCGAGLPIRASKRNKPYLTCNLCGIQFFVRGMKGISRLHEMARRGILIPVRHESAAHGISLLNRLEQLKLQKRSLVQKRKFFVSDKSVEDAISLVDAEIDKVRAELAQTAHKNDGK